MRIVHVLTRFLRAGTEENTAITCNGQVAEGHEVWAVYGREYDERALSLLDPSVKRICVQSLVHAPSFRNDATAVLALRRLFRQLRADVVHTHQSKAGAIGRLAAKLAKTPYIVHGVHIVPFMNAKPVEGFVYRTVERLLAATTDAFIHVTPALKQACLEAGVGRPDQHFVVPSGMDVATFLNADLPHDAAELLQPIAGTSLRPVNVLMVSALEARKRHVPLIEVFRRVVDQAPNARLLLVGVGSEERAIRETIERLQLGDHVRLLGLRSDVNRLIKLADIGVLASEREGLARSVIQYALGGLPIVAPDLPGITRIIEDGGNGYLCSIENLAPMDQHLLKLIRNDVLRHKMAQASAELDLSDWASDRMVERIREIYTSIGAVSVEPHRAAVAVQAGA